MSSSVTTSVASVATELLQAIGFGSEIKVSVQHDPDQDIYQVLLEAPDPALLIGFHGETLSALQVMLGQHLKAKLGEWVNLSVNVNDYRERRESALNNLAEAAVAKVLATGQPHSLPPMSPSERRLVHMYLADHPQVNTASQGVGRSRVLVVSPK